MESTGVYWMALFAVLAERGCDVKLVEAHDARQVPGRKDEVCVLRSSLRQRRMLVAMASRAVQQMQQALEQ